jgi:hypothetical protein
METQESRIGDLENEDFGEVEKWKSEEREE